MENSQPILIGNERTQFKKGRKPWNKGVLGFMPKESVERMINKSKGVRRSPKTEFVKGQNLGEKHPRWIGGHMGHWKNKAMERDNYTCQKCGIDDKEVLTVDHIIPKSTRPDLKSDINNLITLCANCHIRKTKHELKNKIYGRK